MQLNNTIVKKSFRKSLWGLLFPVLLPFYACNKDLGNYQYKDINEITVNGLNDLVLVDKYQRTIVDPDISYSKDVSPVDTSNYKYGWVIFKDQNQADHAPDFTTPVLMLDSTSPFMKTKQALLSGYFTVTDKRTGLFVRKAFRMAIHTPANFGWALLCERNDQTVLGMLSYKNDTAYQSYPNVSAHMGRADTVLPGKPVNIAFVIDNSLDIYNQSSVNIISTDQQIFAATTADLNPAPPAFYNQYFPSITPTPVSPVALKKLDGKSSDLFFRQQNNLYGISTLPGYVSSFLFDYQLTVLNNYNLLTASQNPQPVYNCQQYYGYDASDGSLQSQLFLYNDDRHLFHVLVPGYSSNEHDMAIIGGPDLTNFQIKSLNGLYHDDDKSVILYALFKEVSTGGTWLLIVDDNGVLVSWKKINDLNGDQVGNVSVHPILGYVIYTIGNKVYSYDYNIDATQLMLDFNDEDVSVMGFHAFNQLTIGGNTIWDSYYSSLGDKLIICTYRKGDPDHTGTFRMYEVPASNQPFVELQHYGGFAKIVDFTFNQL